MQIKFVVFENAGTGVILIDLRILGGEIKVRDDPEEIAKNLVQENGLEAARKIVSEGTQTAQLEGDNYGLSVWREVKAILSDDSEVKS